MASWAIPGHRTSLQGSGNPSNCRLDRTIVLVLSIMKEVLIIMHGVLCPVSKALPVSFLYYYFSFPERAGERVLDGFTMTNFLRWPVWTPECN